MGRAYKRVIRQIPAFAEARARQALKDAKKQR
jgi:hypothetical protein